MRPDRDHRPARRLKPKLLRDVAAGRIVAIVVDDDLEVCDAYEAAGWTVDAVICALGTTIQKAGSKEAFRHIDRELPLAFAKLAHERGAESFALTSIASI